MPGLEARLWAAAATLAAPPLHLLLAHRVRRGKEIASRLGERRGLDTTPRPPGKLLWVHAASVGESVSVLPVLALLPAAVTVLMTTGTVTSAQLLAQRLPAMGLQTRVLHRFVPLDVPRWVARFLDHWRPDAAAFLESELWPNLVAGCAARGVALLLLNARMSPNSFAGWRRARGLARQVLGAFGDVLAQSEADATRLRALGAPRAEAVGNLKFAAAPLPADAAELARLQAMLAGRPVWLAANTHAGEEEIAARVHAQLAPRHPGLLTIIAPRHPERGGAIAAALSAPLRSAGAGPAALWVADMLGELGLFYRLAPVVFIGKSLIAGGGGQSPLEAARLGCALAMGPHTDNQAEAVAALAEAGALRVVADAPALAAWADAMLRDPAARSRAGAAAQAVVQRHAQLPARIAALLAARLG